MHELITAIEIQAEIITKLRAEKVQAMREIETLKARIAELEKQPSNT